MRPLREVRLIPYNSYPCFENMAIDEYLISYYTKTQKPILRLYGWNPPSISLGRYQKVNIVNFEKCSEDNIGVVRRVTGGGAILHDMELTYSFTCSDHDLGGQFLSVKESFEKLNVFIINMYKKFGLSAAYAKDIFDEINSGDTALFCFSGNEEYDIIINGRKIGGNAQRRWKNIIFQHGSIPVEINSEKLNKYFNDNIVSQNFTSLEKLLNRKVYLDEVIKNIISSLINIFNFELKEEDINDLEKEEINKLVKKKYSSDKWNMEGRLE